MIALAAASEQQRGWAGPVALIAAWFAFLLLKPLMHKIWNHSPTPPAAGGVKPITAGRLRFSRVDPARDPTRDPAQTGRDPRRDPTPPADDPGVDTDPPLRATTFPGDDPTPSAADPTGDTWFGRIVERGGQRFRAAAHIARTGDSPPPEPERDDFDDALDLVEPDDLDEWLEWAAGVGYNERVRRAMAKFGKSESSVKRRIRELKDEEDET